MNEHPANSVFRALKAMEPEFTRKLSYDEQRALSPEAFGRYCDWVFAFNAPVTQRWVRSQTNRDFDVEYERDRT